MANLEKFYDDLIIINLYIGFVSISGGFKSLQKNLLSYFFGTINAIMSSSDKEQPVGFIPLRIQIIKNYAAFD